MKCSTVARPISWFVSKLIYSAFSSLFLFASISSRSQNYTVNDVADGHATNQLRGAIEAADAIGGTHIITVSAGTYNLSLGQIQFGNRAENITITGAGAVSTVINMTSTSQDRIFLINPPGNIAGVITSISGISFTNGHLKTDLFGGGAILAGGPTNSLTITNCIFTANTIDATAGTTGGAINMSGGGALSIDNCTFSNNTNPKSDGGAVYYFFQNFAHLTGSLIITNSNFSNNTSSVNGGAVGIAAQGRISPFDQTFSANIHNNTFLNNTATTGNGGGIFVDNGDASYSININFNRFVGNNSSAATTSGLAMASASGSVSATNNWWGCNTGPGTNGTCNRAAITGSGGSGTLDISKWLQLKVSASPAALCPTNVGPGNTSLVTASFLKNSSNEDITTGNLSTVIGLPISFTPSLGTLSGAQTAIQSNGTATVTFTAGATPGNGGVNAVVDNIPNTDPTAKAAITIYDPAHISTQPVDVTVCNNGNAIFTVTAAGTPAPTYQWMIGNTPLSEGSKYQGVATQTLTITNAQPADQLNNYNVVVSNACATVPSNNVSLTVNPIPDVNSVSNATYCAGDNVASIQFSGSVAGTVFSWSRTSSDVGSPSSGTGDITAFTAKNTGNSPITASFTVVPSYTHNGVTCTGSSIQFTITVNPVPVVDNVTSATYCAGDNVSSIVFTSAVAGTSFAWSRTAGDIGLGATSGTGSISSFTATNSGTDPVQSTFTVTPSYTNSGVTCTASPIQFTITVKANTSVPTLNFPICAGATSVSGTSNEANGTIITVYSNGTAIGTGSVNEGSWTATVSAVPGAASITAKATATNKCISTASSPVIAISVNATTTSLVSSSNPSFTTSPNNLVTLTATVTSSGNPLTTGTVTFTDGATVIGNNIALNGSGVATVQTSFATEGSHVITATYNQNCPYASSSGTITQQVDNHTSVTGNVYCNDHSGITINDASTASPYPSHLFVSGMGTNLTNIKVHINGLTHASTSDLDVLLVGPHGETLVLLSDVGNAGATNVNLVIDDAAASQLPTASAIVSGSFKPTDAIAGDIFPSPAPASPNHAAPVGTSTLTSVFNGIDPNGTWSLYVVDDNGGNSGTIASWCLELSSCVLTCPDNIIVTTNGSNLCGANVTFGASGSGCGSISYVDQNGNPVVSGGFFPVGTTTVTATGGGTQCSFNVTVNDNTPPVITCGPPQTGYTDASCQAVLPDFTFTTSAIDNCGGPVILIQSPAAGTLVSKGITNVTLTAIDAAGNISSCTNTFTVNDVLAPQITCPADIIASAPANACSAVVNYTIPVAIDACDGTVNVSSDHPSGSSFAVGTTTVHLTATDASGNTANCSFTVTVNDVTAPTITCPANITVNAAPNACSATVTYAAPTATDACGGVIVTTTPASGSSFPVGTTTVTAIAVDQSNNQSICSFTVTVNDVTPPSLTCPSDISVNAQAGQCSAVVNYSAPVGIDLCGTATTTASPASGTSFNVGTTTVNVVSVDGAGNQSTCSFKVTVKDVTAPTFTTGLTATPNVLWPPDHRMKDIALGFAATDDCSPGNISYTVAVTSNEPVLGTGDGDRSPDWIIDPLDPHHVQLRAERGNGKDARVYTITVTATDASGNSTSQTTEVRVSHNITGPLTATPFRVGSTVAFSGVFWDKPGNRHTAQWVINDITNVKASVTEPSGSKNGKITGSYKFSATGIYRLRMNVTDQNKVTSYVTTNDDQEEIIVIYDPNGGYAYGGGHFASPAGALTSDPAATGLGTYGFTVNYYKGASLPKGETHFNFNVGGFQYDALNFDYLSVAGYKAVFAGSGKITGGISGVNFTMYVIDGAIDGTGIDKVRLKIYNKNTNQVYYDNEPGKSDAADPTTPVGLNSTVVISGTNNYLVRTTTQKQITGMPSDLGLKSYPNPSHGSFNVVVSTSNFTDRIILRVTDILGREIENRVVTPNQTVNLGEMYRPGLYIVQVIQGDQRREVKLNKVPD